MILLSPLAAKRYYSLRIDQGEGNVFYIILGGSLSAGPAILPVDRSVEEFF